ncbi:MAG: HIT domain-containing protein [Polyangiaceae bacterium]
MHPPLWAPWRMEYILGPKDHGACVFCGVESAAEEERESRLVVCTGERAFVMMNRYPFAPGHLLVMPYRHVDSLEKLDDEEHDELFRLVRDASVRLKKAVRAEGLNVGCNLGAVAGAGVAAHLHVHVVPRWGGDTNFMPVIADTRVVSQALGDTRKHLLSYFADLERGAAIEAGGAAK